MLKPLISLLLFSIVSLCPAQNIVTGGVVDPIANEGIGEAIVKVKDIASDSTICIARAKLNTIIEERNGNTISRPDYKSAAEFTMSVPIGYTDVLLIISAVGYESVEKEIHIVPNKTRYDIGTISLLPMAKERQLKGATVTATKIKMYCKGDTLVYNADAFNVLQNETLRKLVEQLPNTKIEDGVVYVNGKPIKCLLFSGKDFFNGNIDAALDRLPAYIVSKVKVYDKQGEMSELTGQDMHDKQYVMDVHLKREYIGTWMAKIEADVATENLGGGQGFLMRMDDRQMLSINADVNNFNEQRKMVDIANLVDNVAQGQHKHKVANIEYYIEPNSMWRFSTNASVQRTDQETNTWTSVETFLSPANNITKHKAVDTNSETRINAYVALRARKTKKWQSEFTYDFTSCRKRDLQDGLSLAFLETGNEEWYGWSVDSIYRNVFTTTQSSFLYSLLNPTLQKQTSFANKPEWKTTFVINGNPLNLNFCLSHSSIQNKLYNNYKLDYAGVQTSDHRRIFINQKDYSLTLDVTVDYAFHYGKTNNYDGVIKPYANFKHIHGTASHPYYRMERMQQWSDTVGWGTDFLGVMPQEEWASICFVAENSYYSKNKEQVATAGLNLSHKIMKNSRATVQFVADLSVNYQHKGIDYLRNEQRYETARNRYSFHPDLTFEYKQHQSQTWKSALKFNYKGEYQAPNLFNLLPIADCSDPLNQFSGNPSLQGEYSHRFALRYGAEQQKSQHSLYLSLQYRRVHNDQTTSSVYNTENGARTYQMVNTNRTHTAAADVGYNLPLDKKRNFYLSASMRGSYLQRANLSCYTSNIARGLIQQYVLSPSLALRGTIGRSFRFASSWTTSFSTIKQISGNAQYRETKLNADFSWQLPWNLQLASDFTIKMYNGYADASINKSHCKWNASLAKTFLEDKLSVRISAIGILSPLNYITATIDATSRVETYTNVLPRHFMLSLIYNFDWTQRSRNAR